MLQTKFSVIFLIAFTLSSSSASNRISPRRWMEHKQSSSYWDEHNRIIQKEAGLVMGSDLILSEKEKIANGILMDLKLKEIEKSLNFESEFIPSIHFFQSKSLIEQSDIFKIIQKLPKGGSLHSHLTAMASFDVLFNLTYTPELYWCENGDEVSLKFFFKSTPDDFCHLLSDLRAKNSSFDNDLKPKLNLIVDNPYDVYPNINTVWKRFQSLFSVFDDMLKYRPVFEEMIYAILKEYYEDNVMYIEFRSGNAELYDREGNEIDTSQVIQIILDILAKFKQDYPSDYFNVRMIYAPGRHVNEAKFDSYLEKLKILSAKYPDFVAGFDLVGQEDLGYPLSEFAEKLWAIKDDYNFFFHAGETNWNGGPDINLIDAVLLNTTRIGHGYAISKHPEVLRLVKERNIAIEVNPISNQVLGLIGDLRDHTAASLIATGYPIVITCDDPSFWGSKALSYDWYMAFMGMTNFQDDLRVLKQFALNSLEYTAMTAEERQVAMKAWQKQWDLFIDKINEGKF